MELEGAICFTLRLDLTGTVFGTFESPFRLSNELSCFTSTILFWLHGIIVFACNTSTNDNNQSSNIKNVFDLSKYLKTLLVRHEKSTEVELCTVVSSA